MCPWGYAISYTLKFSFSQDSTHRVADSAVAMERQWFVDRRNQCRAMVEELFDRDVILGRDDSVLHGGDTELIQAWDKIPPEVQAQCMVQAATPIPSSQLLEQQDQEGFFEPS